MPRLTARGGNHTSARAPWRADLVDNITLTRPLAAGWEAELWRAQPLIAVTREAEAAGQAREPSAVSREAPDAQLRLPIPAAGMR